MMLKVALLLKLISIVQADSITCDYAFVINTYFCRMTIYVTDKYDTVNVIDGVHVSGKDNSNVEVAEAIAGKSVIFPKVICAKFAYLKEISFASRGIESLTSDSFTMCTKLEWLVLNANSIQSISSTVFSNKLLHFLNLGNSKIESIAEDAFWNLTALDTLELSYNTQIQLPNLLFHNLTNLRNVKIDNCNLIAWNSWWFNTLKNLVSIDVSLNSIKTIPAIAFHAQVQLKILNVNYNQITRIDRNSFRSLAYLEDFKAEGNRINEIERSFFEDATKLNTANFNKNLCIDRGFVGFYPSRDLVYFDKCFTLYKTRTISRFLNAIHSHFYVI